MNGDLWEIPSNWIWVNLDECVDILDKHRIPVNNRERDKRISGKDEAELYPYYGATGQVGWIDDFIFDEELVLLGEDGAPFLDPKKDVAYIIRGKTWVNNHAHVLRANNDILTNQYLCNFLNRIDYKDFVTGTTRLKLNQTRMKKIPIAVPPHKEQIRIVNHIEELFSRNESGQKTIKKTRKLLDNYKQSFLKHAFTGKLTERWRKKNTIPPHSLATANYEPKKYSNIISEIIPDEWFWINVGQVVKDMRNGIYKPKKFYSDDGIACLRMYNIEDGKLVWKDIKRMVLTEEEVEKYLLNPGDILINRVNSRELVGKSLVIPENIETCVYESKNIRLRVQDQYVLSKYVQLWMHYFSSRYYNFNAQQVVGMASINQQQISDMPIPMTTLEEQRIIVNKFENIESLRENTEKTLDVVNKYSRNLENSILKKSFEGRLVPQDPDDEPASLLLERINLEKQGKIQKRLK
jgi:type I restriction enzyme S subunit